MLACIPCVFIFYQLVQALLERHASSLRAHEIWGNSILALGLWPDSLPSALFATEDSHLSVVRSDGQILAYCLNRMSLKTSSWARLAEFVCLWHPDCCGVFCVCVLFCFLFWMVVDMTNMSNQYNMWPFII